MRSELSASTSFRMTGVAAELVEKIVATSVMAKAMSELVELLW